MGKANNRGGNNICRAYLRFYTYNVFTYCTEIHCKTSTLQIKGQSLKIFPNKGDDNNIYKTTMAVQTQKSNKK
jgi:hypothetical protein